MTKTTIIKLYAYLLWFLLELFLKILKFISLEKPYLFYKIVYLTTSIDLTENLPECYLLRII